MKKNYFCPMCGNREAMNLFITTHKGKRLSLLLASQANIRKSQGQIGCARCKHVGRIEEFQPGKGQAGKLTGQQPGQCGKI